MTSPRGKLIRFAQFLRGQWFGPYGFRAMVTKKFWWDFLRVVKKSGWYLTAVIFWAYYSGYNIANGGFFEISVGTEHYFLYLGLSSFFWGFGFSILAMAFLGKVRSISREFTNAAMHERLAQLSYVACWVDCCKDPACQCGDCMLCGKVLT